MSSAGACRTCLSCSPSISRAAGQRTGGWGKVRLHTHSSTEDVLCLCLMAHNDFLFVEMAVKYFHLAEALYYRILESIIEREKMILGDADLSVSVFSQGLCLSPQSELHAFCLSSHLVSDWLPYALLHFVFPLSVSASN